MSFAFQIECLGLLDAVALKTHKFYLPTTEYSEVSGHRRHATFSKKYVFSAKSYVFIPNMYCCRKKT